jgi:branched-chain amino acid transport system substrate-binding protein
VNKAAATGSIAVQSSPSGADAVLYGGSSTAAAAELFNQTAASSPATRLFGPSALDDPSLVSTLSPAAAKQVEISAPGYTPKSLPAGADAQFVSPFKAAFGHTPATQAIFGYEAMTAVLAVLREAGSAANNRSTVVHDFFAIRNRPSVLGSYTIDPAGDTNLGSFVLDRISGGRLVPFKAVQAQG